MLTQSSFEEIHTIAKDIEGWLSENEANLIYETAASLKNNGCVVEIGSWCAKSIMYMVAGASKTNFNKNFFCVDPFLTSKDEPNGKYETFITNLKNNGIYDKVTHIKEKSQIAGLTFNETIEFLFIDGFHKYEAVKTDFQLFYPKIVEGGYVAIHDVCYYQGPTDLITEISKLDTFKIIAFCDSIILAQKVNKLTKAEEEQNQNFIEAIKSKIIESNIGPIQ